MNGISRAFVIVIFGYIAYVSFLYWKEKFINEYYALLESYEKRKEEDERKEDCCR